MLTIQEVSKLLRVCRSTVYNLIKSGELRAIRVTKRKQVIDPESPVLKKLRN